MWEVVGYQSNFINRKDGSQYQAYDLYLERKLDPGQNREGHEVKAYWYKAADVNYVPVIGDRVFVEIESAAGRTFVKQIHRV